MYRALLAALAVVNFITDAISFIETGFSKARHAALSLSFSVEDTAVGVATEAADRKLDNAYLVRIHAERALNAAVAGIAKAEATRADALLAIEVRHGYTL